MIDVQKTLLSQYANSPIICSLIESMNEIIDPRYLLSDFYDKVLNVMTAEGWGLDVWGRIVGVDRNVQMPDPSQNNFGFKTIPESGDFKPFNQAPFSGAGSKFSAYSLPDDLYRQLVIVKAASNILYATAPNINKYLKNLFNAGAYYVITGHMTASYIFEFELSKFQRLIVYTLKLLPEPCGVLVSYVESPVGVYFGYDGTGYEPFNEGVFLR